MRKITSGVRLEAVDRGPDWQLRHRRERDREPGALPNGAVAVNCAVVLTHDAVRDRQAETGPLTDRLGREERIVDSREVLARNT